MGELHLRYTFDPTRSYFSVYDVAVFCSLTTLDESVTFPCLLRFFVCLHPPFLSIPFFVNRSGLTGHSWRSEFKCRHRSASPTQSDSAKSRFALFCTNSILCYRRSFFSVIVYTSVRGSTRPVKHVRVCRPFNLRSLPVQTDRRLAGMKLHRVLNPDILFLCDPL